MLQKRIIYAPIWDANPFAEDPAENERSEKQYKAWKAFYRDLLPSVAGLEWTQRYRNEDVTYIFGKDVLGEGYRVSVFDSKGAVRHSARETIGELLQHLLRQGNRQSPLLLLPQHLQCLRLPELSPQPPGLFLQLPGLHLQLPGLFLVQQIPPVFIIPLLGLCEILTLTCSIFILTSVFAKSV